MLRLGCFVRFKTVKISEFRNDYKWHPYFKVIPQTAKRKGWNNTPVTRVLAKTNLKLLYGKTPLLCTAFLFLSMYEYFIYAERRFFLNENST